ncbi:MAG TPA: phosphatidate cytidylyltransferase [Paludibacter sp.]|nr:phosphatidate cytidylyltransferase [Paludibacter sp.]
MNNFITRTLSGLFFVAIIVGSVILGSYYFAVVFSIITGWTVFEFHKLTNQQESVSVNPIAGVLGGVILFFTSFLFASGLVQYPLYSVYGLYVVIVLIIGLFYQNKNPLHNWTYFLAGQLYIALPFSLLNYILYIHDVQPYFLLALFIAIWVNDTGAYLVGSTFGKHKLFERISPKKTWEGFIGGALLSLISGYVFSLLIPEISLIQWLIFSEIVVVFGTFGDLAESLMKRTVDVKDSGNAIPGHGGLLDRFDSMLLAGPVIFFYLSILFK